MPAVADDAGRPRRRKGSLGRPDSDSFVGHGILSLEHCSQERSHCTVQRSAARGPATTRSRLPSAFGSGIASENGLLLQSRENMNIALFRRKLTL
jgi:hypothetical protein